jgi:glutathionylspermidine synthase
MKREVCAPRANWQELVQELGFHGWRHADGAPYWVEDACFVLSEAEVEILHAAAGTCEALVREALVGLTQSAELMAAMGLPKRLAEAAARTWRRCDPSLYGRFDFAWDGQGPPKLLEYNADTPTALYEAAVIQWRWLIDRDPHADQYNAIHERLIAAFARLKAPIATGGRLHLTAMNEEVDDLTTIAYLADCAEQAGVTTALIDIADIGLKAGRLVDLDDRPITHLFKLYPWEWLVEENKAFVDALFIHDVGVLEPAWRAVAASKGILPALWNLAPGHPNLLHASFDPAAMTGDHVVKPVFGREGANISQRFELGGHETEGDFAHQAKVCQARAPMVRHAGGYPVFGVWVIAGDPCGLGIREDDSEITGPKARFIPHRMA